MKPPIKKISSLQFLGKSSYKSDFVSMDINCKNRPYPVLSVHDNSKFNTVSTSHDVFKNFYEKAAEYKKRFEDKLVTFNFPGQFVSENQRKFVGKPLYSKTISGKRADNPQF
jgi:hypothetical protein